MNFADYLLILASACQTFVERTEASKGRDRLTDLDALEERLGHLTERADRRDLEARHQGRTITTIQGHLDAAITELRHLADRLAALEALLATTTTTTTPKPHVDAPHVDAPHADARHTDAPSAHNRPREDQVPPAAVPPAEGHATPPTDAASPPLGEPPRAYLVDLFGANRGVIRKAMDILCDAGVPSEEARQWFASGAWSKPRQRTDAHRKARQHLTAIAREYGRRGTVELHRTIDLYATELAWEIHWKPATNVTLLRRVAES